jgi:DNA ligase D-like protein (predicted 3'-phosphoesterase)
MTLTQYSKKRNLKSSKEPKAVSKKTSSKKLIYTVQEHHASHLHWDLRLEFDGVLKSWALPKAPPEKKGEKRLAIEVEDHPLEYAKFQGTIPEGNYGAGKVTIWDNGDYELLKIYKDRTILEIHGKKLKGKYCLLKANFKGKRNWLFFKI